MCSRSAYNRELLVSPRWVNIAPLGTPVVPEVYWIWTMSSGLTSGSSAVAGAEARNSSHSLKKATSRSAGRSGRTSSRYFSIGLRNSRTRKIPADWDCARTCRSSAGRYAGLTVTESQAGEGRPELQDNPLRQVGRPHRDALSGGEPCRERACRPFGVRQELAEGPAAPRGGVRQATDHRERIGPPCGRVTQRAADRRLQHRHRGVRGPVRRRQSHAGLPRPMRRPGAPARDAQSVPHGSP